jgi:hypothetical protein
MCLNIAVGRLDAGTSCMAGVGAMLLHCQVWVLLCQL